jgi:hypothetical protein
LTKLDFLELSYDNIGFLVSRDQFFSSQYLDNPEDEAVYNGERLFTFNLDECLNEKFRFSSSNDLRLALICSVDSYTDYNKKRAAGIFENNSGISDSFIALKIGSRSEINSIFLGEINLMPGALGEFHKRHGILGVRFKTSDYPQFLIDIESFVLNSIFKERITE